MLCACGCGLPANPDLGAFVDYQHAGRYERNGRRAVPLPPANEPGIQVAKRCPHCGRKIRGDVCSVSSCRSPDRINWKALTAAVAGSNDPYPLETTSADVTLSSPCSEEDTFRLRQRERGLVQVECGGCGGVAWQEPPCVVNGVEMIPVRCKTCDKRPCAECGERPRRYGGQYCAPCWRAKREETQTMAATATKNGKATKTCPYCNKAFEPYQGRDSQITCGSKPCKNKHIVWLGKNPRHKQPAIDPAAVLDRAKSDEAARGDQDGPGLCGSPDNAGLPVAPTLPAAEEVVAKSYGLTPPQLDAAMDFATADPILRAVEALEAVPWEKWPGIFEVLQARRDAQMAAKRAEEMLASLGVA